VGDVTNRLDESKRTGDELLIVGVGHEFEDRPVLPERGTIRTYVFSHYDSEGTEPKHWIDMTAKRSGLVVCSVLWLGNHMAQITSLGFTVGTIKSQWMGFKLKFGIGFESVARKLFYL
jgi:hypothetical protein